MRKVPIFVVFLVLSAISLGRVQSYFWVDTRDYLHHATFPVFSPEVWAGHRAPLFPLVLKALHGNFDVLYVVQVLLAVFAFSFLTLTLWPSVRTRGARAFLIIAVLALGLSSPVALWNYAPLSESISNSLSIILVALAYRLVREWTWGRAGAILFVATLWVADRDANAFELLAVSAMTIVAVVAGARRRNLVFVGAFLAMFLVASYSSDRGGRWVHASLNLLVHRILPNAEARSYFAARGMPITPQLMKQQAQSVNDPIFFQTPELRPFADWWMANGRRTWATFLLTHPLYLLHPLLTDGRDMYGPNMEVYESSGFHSAWRAALSVIAYPEGPGLVVFTLICALMVGMALPRRDWLRSPERWIPLALVLLGFGMGLFNQHCDAREIPRHAVHTNLHLRLGLWLLVAQALDAFLE
jgi:hypothetical protein